MAPGYAETLDRMSDGLARICAIYGANPLYGRLYAALFLSPEPLTLEELAERASAAKSTVSVAVRKLVDARVVRRVWRKADRRDWYEASTDPHRVLRDLVERYVRPELDVWIEVGGFARRAVAEATGDDWPGPEGLRALAARLDALDRFARAWDTALGALEGEDARPLRRVTVEFDR